MIRFRALMIAAGYKDGNDCDTLRDDPAYKMAVGRLPYENPRVVAENVRTPAKRRGSDINVELHGCRSIDASIQD